MLPVCERYGMGVLVWSPLAMGLLMAHTPPAIENATLRRRPAAERAAA